MYSVPKTSFELLNCFLETRFFWKDLYIKIKGTFIHALDSSAQRRKTFDVYLNCKYENMLMEFQWKSFKKNYRIAFLYDVNNSFIWYNIKSWKIRSNKNKIDSCNSLLLKVRLSVTLFNKLWRYDKSLNGWVHRSWKTVSYPLLHKKLAIESSACAYFALRYKIVPEWPSYIC